jgi:hypothetical protein
MMEQGTHIRVRMFKVEHGDINNPDYVMNIQLIDTSNNKIIKELETSGFNYTTAIEKAFEHVLMLW